MTLHTREGLLVARATSRIICRSPDVGANYQGVCGVTGNRVLSIYGKEYDAREFDFPVLPKRTGYEIFNSLRVSTEGNPNDLAVVDPATVTLRENFRSPRRKADFGLD